MNPLENITTPADLLAFLQKGAAEEVSVENFRYAIYVRKSTDDNENQVRSIEDQLAECHQLAHDKKLIVLKDYIFDERESAQESGIRPKFLELLRRIEGGEIDGIIAWHPNRLSRNMLEAGKIIDMLDKGIIKDLKFASHTFVNDPSGKMLLGIVFVMAKQYSDQLSIDVKRGIDRSIEAGAYINKSKHGYRKDNMKRLQPDGENYSIMKEAFQRRLRGDTLKSIANFLNAAGYTRQNAIDGKIVKTKFSEQVLNKIFKDSVYAGILKYGDNIVNLFELYDFMPMITVAEYMQLNDFDSFEQAFKLKKNKKKQAVTADFLNSKVFCSACGEMVQANINKGNTKKYYNFKCTTYECARYGKSTRAKVIVDFVKDFLAQKPFSSPKAYSSYKAEIIRLQYEGMTTMNSQINAAKRKIGLDKDDIESIKRNLAKESDATIAVIQKEQLKKIEAEILKTETLLKELIAKKENMTKAPLTFQEFIEIMNSVADRVSKVRSTTELNAIFTKIFSNFVVSSKNVENYRLNPPFDTLFETKVSHCAG